MPDPLEALRHDVLQRRMHGITGGLHVFWRSADIARVRHHVFALHERDIIGVAETRFFDAKRSVSAPPAPVLRRAMDSTALSWQCRITNETPDLMGDVIKLKGWNLQNFGRNGPVMFAHDISALPIGQSSLPRISGDALMACVEFPAPSISEASDQVRTMVAAGILRGCSVGFIPGKFKFSTDRARGPLA